MRVVTILLIAILAGCVDQEDSPNTSTSQGPSLIYERFAFAYAAEDGSTAKIAGEPGRFLGIDGMEHDGTLVNIELEGPVAERQSLLALAASVVQSYAEGFKEVTLALDACLVPHWVAAGNEGLVQSMYMVDSGAMGIVPPFLVANRPSQERVFELDEKLNLTWTPGEPDEATWRYRAGSTNWIMDFEDGLPTQLGVHGITMDAVSLETDGKLLAPCGSLGLPKAKGVPTATIDAEWSDYPDPPVNASLGVALDVIEMSPHLVKVQSIRANPEAYVAGAMFVPASLSAGQAEWHVSYATPEGEIAGAVCRHLQIGEAETYLCEEPGSLGVLGSAPAVSHEVYEIRDFEPVLSQAVGLDRAYGGCMLISFYIPDSNGIGMATNVECGEIQFLLDHETGLLQFVAGAGSDVLIL